MVYQAVTPRKNPCAVTYVKKASFRLQKTGPRMLGLDAAITTIILTNVQASCNSSLAVYILHFTFYILAPCTD